MKNDARQEFDEIYANVLGWYDTVLENEDFDGFEGTDYEKRVSVHDIVNTFDFWGRKFASKGFLGIEGNLNTSKVIYAIYTELHILDSVETSSLDKNKVLERYERYIAAEQDNE